jgi:acetyl esterase
MLLEAEMEAFITRSDALMPPGYIEASAYIDASAAEQRRLYDTLCRAFDAPRPSDLEVRDARAPGPAGDIPLRVYRPPGPDTQAGLVYMHGGGFYLGGLDSHDSITAELAARAGVTVIAVDYRLAPEHRFPAAFEDSLAALNWVMAEAGSLGLDRDRIGVGGDSAGGNLAAALCLAARAGRAAPIRAQLLVYPSVARRSDDDPPPANPNLPLMSYDDVRFCDRLYLGGAGTTDDPYAAPILAGELSGLPPAAILAAELDVIADDSRLYAAALEAAGVAAALEVAPGLPHGFLRARHMSPAAGRAFTWLCDRTAALLRG